MAPPQHQPKSVEGSEESARDADFTCVNCALAPPIRRSRVQQLLVEFLQEFPSKPTFLFLDQGQSPSKGDNCSDPLAAHLQPFLFHN